jgi:hypothetical protein
MVWRSWFSLPLLWHFICIFWVLAVWGLLGIFLEFYQTGRGRKVLCCDSTWSRFCCILGVFQDHLSLLWHICTIVLHLMTVG